MYKKVLRFLAAFFPLVVVNGYCLASGYFERGNIGVNANLVVLFLVLSLLISVSKLFFDFFATVVTSRCTGLEPNSGNILNMLLYGMVPQWVFTLVCLIVSRLVFGNGMQLADLVIFAAAHTVYYGFTAYRQIKTTGKKAFGYVYGAVALVCWIYAIVNIVDLLAK